MSVFVLVAAILATVSCGGSGDGQKSSSGPGASINVPSVNRADSCDPGYKEFSLTPENSVEAWYGPSLRACWRNVPGNLYQLKVINAGPAVWVVEDMQWSANALRSGPVAVQIFRQALNGQYDGLAVEPGHAVVASVPMNYLPRFHLDVMLQSAWELASRTVNAVKSKAKQFIMTKFSPEFRAGIACAQAGYSIAGRLSPLVNTTDPAEALDRTYQSATDVGQCKSAIDEAREAAKKSGSPALTLEDFRVAAVTDETVVERSGQSLLSALRNGARSLFKAIR